ncbi:MAG: PEGA domain-containing protein [Verrucomicrobiota bacterium]
MRLSAPLLVLCAGLVGCSTSDSNLSDTVTVTSNPTAAAVRLNGEAVGRTPTKVTLDRTKTYEMSVGKGGFVTETATIRPKAINTKKGVEFGFPETIQFTLTKVPGAGDVTVPEQDTAEFKKLVKRANGDTSDESSGIKADLAGVAESARRMQDPAVQPKTPEAKQNYESALKSLAARAAELEKQVDVNRGAAKAETAKELAQVQKALEEQKTAAARAREELVAAKADAEAKLAAANKNSDAKSAAEAKAAKDAAVAAEGKAKAAEAKLAAANKAAAEARKKADAAAKAEADAKAAALAAEAKAAEAAKAAEQEIAKARLAAEETKTEAMKAAEAKVAEAAAAAAEAKTAAEAKASEATNAAEQEVAKAKEAADAAKAAAAKAAAAEFSARFALLESRRRSKAITEEEYAEQLAALRKRMGE